MLTNYSFSEEKLEFSIISNKNEIVQYEPLIINFQLKNVGITDCKIIGVMDYDAGSIRLEIGEFEGKFYRYDTGMHSFYAPKPKILKPNQLFSSQLIIYTYRKPIKLDKISKIEDLDNSFILYPFAELGNYKIYASFLLEGNWVSKESKILKSNVLEIKVLPLNEIDHSALNYFKKFDDFAHAVGACCPDNYEESLKIAENFISLYPNSHYTLYVKYDLALSYYHGIGLSEPDYSKAYELFEDIAKHAPALLADDALFYLAELQIKLSRLKDAKQTVDKLIKEYSFSNNIPNARRIRDGLDQGYVNLDDIFSKISAEAAIDAK